MPGFNGSLRGATAVALMMPVFWACLTDFAEKLIAESCCSSFPFLPSPLAQRGRLFSTKIIGKASNINLVAGSVCFGADNSASPERWQLLNNARE